MRVASIVFLQKISLSPFLVPTPSWTLEPMRCAAPDSEKASDCHLDLALAPRPQLQNVQIDAAAA